MGRKRDTPFKRDKMEMWAASAYAVGSINFLFDQSFEPFNKVKEISVCFGTKNSTVSNKVRQIKEMFDMTIFNNEFATEHTKDINPFNDLVIIDGLKIPSFTIPENLQEMVKKERAEE